MELVEGACDAQPPQTVLAAINIFRQAAGVAGHALPGLRPLRSQAQQHHGHVRRQRQSDRPGPGLPHWLGEEAHSGHARFHPPEQVRREPVTVQTDVYNFGATFYWCLTGRNVPTLFT